MEHLLVAPDHFSKPLDRRGLILVADGGALLEERVEQAHRLAAFGAPGRKPWRRAGRPARHAEVHDLPEAVLDVQSHPAERLHERLDVEGLVRAGVEEANQAGSQR